ncbi:MAG: hypothetical protein KGJ49_03670 [Alphaproteobacteria bacterium]|nr:hypothetical protein [Alphaproteobacteria bacterium]
MAARILFKLTGRGAKIEGTEDPDLLRKEYELMMTGLSAGAGTGGAAQTDKAESAAVFRDLLDRRDRFIARH